MTSKEIRDSFKDFFEKKGHKVVPSAPMVIKDDPTLMFTNAGMNQFKDIILGHAEIKHSRVTDSQKCLRVSGKHNDLEEVGHDTYHHTMFEMLGNWSFGDYFKAEAIAWAWEFLTDVLKIDKNRLYVTIFEGAEAEGLERDQEAFDVWKSYISEERILNGNRKDNFWEMGDQGPCGPCSEIHIDLRSESERQRVSGADLVNKDHPQVIEIWNLVFMQYNRKADGTLEGLPNKVIDTGMGFERLCMAIQGKTSNYDTDVFTPIIQSITTLTGIKYGASEEQDIAMRVIADHVRTIAFSIADGQLPSNAKAGYVIRRILRRAVRYGYTFLGRKEAFMYTLLPVLIEVMGEAYPELEHNRDLIRKVIKEEEDSFLRTLEVGIRMLDGKMQELKTDKASKGELSGADAFVLYDTYGFPLDLTALILSENGLTVDQKGFDQAMQEQKARARNAASVDASDWHILQEGESTFVGYEKDSCSTQILRYRKITQKKTEFYQVVLSTTPFYAEMGGQVGDTGFLHDGENKYEVFDTKNENKLAVHLMKQLPNNVDATFEAKINQSKRRQAEANHTATHILHKVLRDFLGTHVEQKGSLVSPDLLRFDFSHFSKVESQDLRKIEELVNKAIRRNSQAELFIGSIEEAKQRGAMALFGEKYGDEVRVMHFGDSIELCGGTHVRATGDIGYFRIISESSVAAGIRRIEAVTGEKAEQYAYEKEDLLLQVQEKFNNNPKLLTAVQKLLDEYSALSKQMEEVEKERVAMLKAKLLADQCYKNDIRLFILDSVSPAVAKDIAFQLMGELKESFVFIASGQEGNEKCSLSLMISKDLVEAQSLNASTILRSAAKHIQGGGGGQAHFSTAGGRRPNGIKDAVDQIISDLSLK